MKHRLSIGILRKPWTAPFAIFFSVPTFHLARRWWFSVGTFDNAPLGSQGITSGHWCRVVEEVGALEKCLHFEIDEKYVTACESGFPSVR
jgi:hypothetical protein